MLVQTVMLTAKNGTLEPTADSVTVMDVTARYVVTDLRLEGIHDPIEKSRVRELAEVIIQ
jgi:hypothetical protein